RGCSVAGDPGDGGRDRADSLRIADRVSPHESARHAAIASNPFSTVSVAPPNAIRKSVGDSKNDPGTTATLRSRSTSSMNGLSFRPSTQPGQAIAALEGT